MKARTGFALPVVLLAMFLLVGALASGFAMVRSERSADDAVVQLQAAQALDGNGVVQGNVVAGTSSILRPSANAAANTVGTLTINGNLSMTSATNFFNLSSDPTGLVSPSDVIQVNGNLSASGVNTTPRVRVSELSS